MPKSPAPAPGVPGSAPGGFDRTSIVTSRPQDTRRSTADEWIDSAVANRDSPPVQPSPVTRANRNETHPTRVGLA
jgi:hypothetical protein